MLSRNFILWPSSWQPGDRETKRERERGGHRARGTGALGVQCRVGELGEAALPSQHSSSSPAAGSRAPVSRGRHSRLRNGRGYLFWAADKGPDEVHGFLFLFVQR